MYVIFLKSLAMLSAAGGFIFMFSDAPSETKLIYVFCAAISAGIWYCAGYAMELLEKIAGVDQRETTKREVLPKDKAWERKRLGK